MKKHIFWIVLLYIALLKSNEVFAKLQSCALKMARGELLDAKYKALFAKEIHANQETGENRSFTSFEFNHNPDEIEKNWEVYINSRCDYDKS